MKKVSIIIPCYNQAEFVGQAIESALTQTYENIEVVCVNDGSTDDSDNVIRKYAEKYRNILYINCETNNGLVYTKNIAINASQGEYILPLDADDIIKPEYVEKAVETFEQLPDTTLVYCKSKYIKNGKKIFWDIYPETSEKLLYKNYIFNSAMFKKSDFEKVGGYKEYMNKGLEDWDLWLSFLELYTHEKFKVIQLDETYFYYRKHATSGNNVSLKYIDKLYENLFLNHQKLYLADKKIFSRIFCIDYDVINKNLEKYKKLFNIILTVCILLSLLILLGLFGNGFYG